METGTLVASQTHSMPDTREMDRHTFVEEDVGDERSGLEIASTECFGLEHMSNVARILFKSL